MKKINFIVLLSLSVTFLSGCVHIGVGTNYLENYQCSSSIKNASYVGAYKGEDSNLDSKDLSQDIYCANKFKNQPKYSHGFVTVFGSSRIREINTLDDTKAAQANSKLYHDIMNFSEKWAASKYGKVYPIMTGAGSGIMEAASRGAMKAGGPSIGYTTYYDPEPRGDANEAFWSYGDGKQQIITDGLIFSSVSIRETMMILHSSAIILAPGGTGSEWELFQILEMAKSNQLKKIPIYLVGNKEEHWKSFDDRLKDMVRRGTVKEGEVTKQFIYVEDPTALVDLLLKDLPKP